MKKEVESILDKYKKILKLRGWKFEVIYSEDDTCYAEVIPFINDKRAIIKINPVMNENIEDLKDTLIHELLHIFLTPYTDQVEVDLDFIGKNPESAGKMNFKKILNRVSKKEEVIVEKLTTIIGELTRD